MYVSTTRSHETEAIGVSVVSRPAHPDGEKSPFLSRDYWKEMADGRAQACHGVGSSARSRSAGAIAASAHSHSAWTIRASVDCVRAVDSLTLDCGLRDLSCGLGRSTPAIDRLRYVLSRDYVRGVGRG